VKSVRVFTSQLSAQQSGREPLSPEKERVDSENSRNGDGLALEYYSVVREPCMHFSTKLKD
jgi:hypothetical protein